MTRSGKGLGAKRHRLRNNIQGIMKPSIPCLARRGGVIRISGVIYEETLTALSLRMFLFLVDVMSDAIIYAKHAKRKTVTAMDVHYALEHQGRTGFED